MKKFSALLLGAALCAGAQAATLSYNFGFAQETTDINQTGSLGLFDSSLGRLTGVSLQLSANELTRITLINNAATTASTRGVGVLELTFTSSLTALNDLLGVDPQITLTASTGTQTLASGASRTFGPFTDSDTYDLSLNSILSAFSRAGGGNFDLGCSSQSGVQITGGGGNISSTQSTTAGCGAVITYTYDESTTPNPTPEPASLALVGLGLIGVATARRKSRKA